jgi:phosphoribosylformylglycinamidine synthase
MHPWKEHGLTEEEYGSIKELMGREPNHLELSFFGVMWSEHCSYKNSKAQLRKLPVTGSRVVQGPGENAGVVRLDDETKLCAVFKMESHNHPSAVDPYEGAATGIGGIVRDVFTMGARPVALLDSLRFGPLDDPRARELFRGVTAGAAAYGDGIGVPTVGGETLFHPSYLGNPLVNVMCVGLVREDKIFKGRATGVGNVVMLVGAHTGRDGIGGASFASEELSDSEKRSNVPAGDPGMEKLLMEASLEVMEAGLVVGLQDLGAAGLTSSGSEMAARAGNGIRIDIDCVPLREPGMQPWEVMLSESQERMLMVVEPSKMDRFMAVFEKWGLTAAAVGEVTGDGKFTINRGGEILGSVPAEFLTGKAPVNIRPYTEPAYFNSLKKADFSKLKNYGDWTGLLKKLLASPNIASKRWAYEQYGSAGNDVLVLPPNDAAVLRLPDSDKGMALATDCNSRYVYLDPWRGGAIAVAESARNVAASGARPLAITNGLNFGNPEKPEVYWQFVQATDGMAEACKALSTPITGGNVSFYNEYDGKAIYPALAIGMLGLIDNVENRVTSEFKSEGDVVILAGETLEELGASEAHSLLTGRDEGEVPVLDFEKEKNLHEFLFDAASNRLLASAHDCSDGGLAVAAAESAIGGKLGVTLDWAGDVHEAAALFAESQSRAVISVAPDKLQAAETLLKKHGLRYTVLGKTGGSSFIARYNGSLLIECPVDELSRLWNDSIGELMKCAIKGCRERAPAGGRNAASSVSGASPGRWLTFVTSGFSPCSTGGRRALGWWSPTEYTLTSRKTRGLSWTFSRTARQALRDTALLGMCAIPR